MSAILFKPQCVNLPWVDSGIFQVDLINTMDADALAPGHQQPRYRPCTVFVFYKEEFQQHLSVKTW